MHRSHSVIARNLATHSKTRLPMATGSLPAGPAAEITEDYDLVDLNFILTGGRLGFQLYELTGRSMVDTIPDGAIVVCDTWAEPRNGSIIAYSLNGEVGCKEVQVSERRLSLVPRSPDEQYKSRVIGDGDSLYVLGVITAHLSMYRR